MDYDVIILGAGPAGYEGAAIAAAQGKKVALVEKDHVGGTCLNRGCIPTKCLLHSAQEHQSWQDARQHMEKVVTTLRGGIDQLLRGVTVYNGIGKIAGDNTVEVEGQKITADRIIISTGSKPSTLPVPGAEFCMNSDDVLSLERLPQSVVIIGGGVIGIEFAFMLSGFGVNVTVVEYCKEILPGFDADLCKRLRQMLTRKGIKIIVGAQVQAVEDARVVKYLDKKGEQKVEGDAVIMAVGRRAVMPEGLESAGVEVNRRGITVNDKFQTTNPNIYAVGDCNAKTMLAHVAAAQMRTVLGEEVNLSVVPAVVFTTPELAMVGKTEDALKEEGIPYKTAKVMVASNGKALSMGADQGLVKLLVGEDKKILGCHILAPHASDLIAEPALCMANGLTVEAINHTIHSHPSLNEMIAAAASQCE